MAIYGTTRANELKATRMKIAIVGEAKVGKDWFACTAPGHVYVFDFDDRKDSLIIHPNSANIEPKTYHDVNPMKPLAWKEFESDVAEFQEMAARGEKVPDWFDLSSMQYMSEACMNFVLCENKAMRKEIKSGDRVTYIPFGWDPYTLVANLIRDNIAALHTIANVICVFHETYEKDKVASTKEQTKYTGKVDVFPVNLKKLLPLFNDQWRLVTFNGTRKVITDISDSEFNGATTLLLDSEEEPNITKMLEKHRSRVNGK